MCWYGSLVFPVHLLELAPSPMPPFEVPPSHIRETRGLSPPCMILTSPYATPNRLTSDSIRKLCLPSLRSILFPLHRIASRVVTWRDGLQQSWGSPPSMFDFSRLAMLRPLPPPVRMISACWYHPTRHVPPLWSLSTPTICSAATSQAYCVLLPVMRFDTFHSFRDVWTNPSVCAPAPRTAISDPSKNATRQQPYRVTTTVASLVFLASFRDTSHLPIRQA